MLITNCAVALRPSSPFNTHRWYVLRSDNIILFGQYFPNTETSTWADLPPVPGSGSITTISVMPGLNAIDDGTPAQIQLCSDNVQAFMNDGSIWNLVSNPNYPASWIESDTLPQT